VRALKEAKRPLAGYVSPFTKERMLDATASALKIFMNALMISGDLNILKQGSNAHARLELQNLPSASSMLSCGHNSTHGEMSSHKQNKPMMSSLHKTPSGVA
jgi:hypothetical protein